MAVIQRYRPFRGTSGGFDEAFDRIWRGAGARSRARGDGSQWTLPLDVVQDDERLVVNASLPGFELGDIGVSVDDGVLIIQAQTAATDESGETGSRYLLRERGYGSVRRSLRLPENVDAELAESELRNGVLSVTFPKIEEAKPRQIEVKVAA